MAIGYPFAAGFAMKKCDRFAMMPTQEPVGLSRFGYEFLTLAHTTRTNRSISLNYLSRIVQTVWSQTEKSSLESLSPTDC